jgi:Ca2+/Na+ antiporter
MENIVTWILLLYTLLDKGSNERIKTIMLYAIVVLLIKGVPIYIMSQYPIQIWPSICTSVLLFCFYCIYLWFRQTNLIEIYRATYVSIIRGDNRTPMFSALSAFGMA